MVTPWGNTAPAVEFTRCLLAPQSSLWEQHKALPPWRAGTQSAWGHGDHGEATSSQEPWKSSVSRDIASRFPHPSGNTPEPAAPASPRHGRTRRQGAGAGQTGVRDETEPRQEVTRVYYLTAAAWRAQAHADRARPACPASARSAPAAHGPAQAGPITPLPPPRRLGGHGGGPQHPAPAMGHYWKRTRPGGTRSRPRARGGGH